VRQQPETFSASLNPRMAASDPLFDPSVECTG
jgi:hypothetical protein